MGIWSTASVIVVFEGLLAGQVWCSCFKTGTKRWLHGGRVMGGGW